MSDDVRTEELALVTAHHTPHYPLVTVNTSAEWKSIYTYSFSSQKYFSEIEKIYFQMVIANKTLAMSNEMGFWFLVIIWVCDIMK